MGALKYLLDTHVFLWAMQKDVKLSNTAKIALSDASADKYVSSISAYEIMYKSTRRFAV